MWNFYYDEAFHDRSISIKDGNEINIYKNGASDIYVGFFCGYDESLEPKISQQYLELDYKYRELFTIPDNKELKGTTLKRQNYIHGFASLKKLSINFYNDLFNLLDDPNIIFHISMFSKTELIVREFMRKISFSYKYKLEEETIIYILTKFLFNYREQAIIKKMMEASTPSESIQVLHLLRTYILKIVEQSGDSKKKLAERNALSELYYILEYARISNYIKPELSWRYEPIFIGFNKLLKERKISPENVSLVIDTEERTYTAAKDIGKYGSCKQGASEAYTGIRIADFLSHFLGSLAVALIQELNEGEIKSEDDLNQRDYVTKKLLSPDWFTVTEQQFNLWNKIESVILNYQFYEWTGYNGVFCDFPALVFALLEYVKLYENYDEFRSVEPENHRDSFNTYCCNKLANLYRRAGTEPAIY
ncbi:MAG: hypothetical protein HDT27_05205 [Subdoligranulum sp.]|nr:hypothetical protein [Subdoligranulum sp.]